MRVCRKWQCKVMCIYIGKYCVRPLLFISRSLTVTTPPLPQLAKNGEKQGNKTRNRRKVMEI